MESHSQWPLSVCALWSRPQCYQSNMPRGGTSVRCRWRVLCVYACDVSKWTYRVKWSVVWRGVLADTWYGAWLVMCWQRVVWCMTCGVLYDVWYGVLCAGVGDADSHSRAIPVGTRSGLYSHVFLSIWYMYISKPNPHEGAPCPSSALSSEYCLVLKNKADIKESSHQRIKYYVYVYLPYRPHTYL